MLAIPEVPTMQRTLLLLEDCYALAIIWSWWMRREAKRRLAALLHLPARASPSRLTDATPTADRTVTL